MQNKHMHVTPVKTYITIAVLLLMLTGLTVTISFVPLGAFNITVALAIASVKALLVAFFFMHLFYDNKVYLVIFGTALLFLTIFLTLTMFDTSTRGSIYEEKKNPIRQEAPIYKEKQ